VIAITTHRIKQLLADADTPLSTNDIATQLGVSWNTAANKLNDLHTQNEVHRKQVNNRLTLWSLNEIQF